MSDIMASGRPLLIDGVLGAIYPADDGLREAIMNYRKRGPVIERYLRE